MKLLLSLLLLNASLCACAFTSTFSSPHHTAGAAPRYSSNTKAAVATHRYVNISPSSSLERESVMAASSQSITMMMPVRAQRSRRRIELNSAKGDISLSSFSKENNEEECATTSSSSSSSASSLLLKRRGFFQRTARDLSATAAAALLLTSPFSSSNIIANAAEEVQGESTKAAAAGGILNQGGGSVNSIVNNNQAAPDAASIQRGKIAADTRTIYDFSLPVQGVITPLTTILGDDPRPLAILVTNIKQDDPLARSDIPQLISLANKYSTFRIHNIEDDAIRVSREEYASYEDPSTTAVATADDADNDADDAAHTGGLRIIAVPSDQGYYEPDTSALMRMKMRGEYGYGNTPETQLIDKVEFLGPKAHPFMRWLEGTCRTPTSGLGSIQLNFEKWLVDGRTGLPLRRYPRKYSPEMIEKDIVLIMEGKELEPLVAGDVLMDAWAEAELEAKTNEYAFKKGLNYYIGKGFDEREKEAKKNTSNTPN
jgi:glutathione peroxidase-family protein